MVRWMIWMDWPGFPDGHPTLEGGDGVNVAARLEGSEKHASI